LPELHELAVDATSEALPAKRFSINGESGLDYGPRGFGSHHITDCSVIRGHGCLLALPMGHIVWYDFSA
jgi:hypothetical protein